MLSRILFPEEVACIPGEHCYAICGVEKGCANFAFPTLIVRILPSGIRGLMTAVMLAALMSDLESIFNSASTLFTIDIWSKMRPRATQLELVFVGKVIVIFLTVWGVCWIPIIEAQNSAQLFLYGQDRVLWTIFFLKFILLWNLFTSTIDYGLHFCSLELRFADKILFFLRNKPYHP